MNQEKVISEADLIKIYRCIELYIKSRYEAFSIEELCVIRRVIKNIEAEYEANGPEAPTIQSALKRNAGRKPVYDQDNAEQILSLHEQGYSIRQIAKMTDCSTGRVNSVLKKER